MSTIASGLLETTRLHRDRRAIRNLALKAPHIYASPGQPEVHPLAVGWACRSSWRTRRRSPSRYSFRIRGVIRTPFSSARRMPPVRRSIGQRDDVMAQGAGSRGVLRDIRTFRAIVLPPGGKARHSTVWSAQRAVYFRDVVSSNQLVVMSRAMEPCRIVGDGSLGPGRYSLNYDIGLMVERGLVPVDVDVP